jgi:hypothetical protein
MGATSVMFCACLPECASEARQTFLPSDDDALSAIKLPPLSKDLLLHFDNHCQQGR